jgi:hypothetical protein
VAQPRARQFILKIAADDITKLRRLDVFRVLENCSDDELSRTANYITDNRPDLKAEVNDCLAELSSDGR